MGDKTSTQTNKQNPKMAFIQLFVEPKWESKRLGELGSIAQSIVHFAADPGIVRWNPNWAK